MRTAKAHNARSSNTTNQVLRYSRFWGRDPRRAGHQRLPGEPGYRYTEGSNNTMTAGDAMFTLRTCTDKLRVIIL